MVNMEVTHEGSTLVQEKKKKLYKYITVEPVMFFYMFAFMITSVVEQSFFVHKACIANHHLPPEICNHLNETNNTQYNNEIQKTVSTFHQWNGISGHVVPIILALFLGAWSDKRGRKAVLISGLVGKFIYSFMVVMITLQESWPLQYVIYFATIPSALTGADVAVFAAAFSYISDVTTTYDRTLRVGILDICYLSTMPTGIALGSYLFTGVFNKSYTILFCINASLLVLAIVIALFNLRWQTSDKQQSMAQAGVKNFFCDFFDKDHAIDSLKVLVKYRPSHRRVYLSILMISMALYTFQRDEKPMLYLYMVKVFGWDTVTYSNFKTFQSCGYVIMMIIGIPLMSRLFKWKDTSGGYSQYRLGERSLLRIKTLLEMILAVFSDWISIVRYFLIFFFYIAFSLPSAYNIYLLFFVILMVGATSHTLGRVFFTQAKVSWLFYVGAGVASLGPCVAPVLRSITSKTVQVHERGKAFALLSVCDNAVTLFSASLYSQLYNATVNTDHPNAIFYLTMATQIVVFLLSLGIHIALGGEPMEKYSSETENKVKKIENQKSEIKDNLILL